MDNIAVLGGTFNPVHKGHIKLGLEVLKKFDIENVIFMPTGEPPHKSDIADKEHRYNMLRLALQNEDRFTLSRLELDRKGKTYTIDTIREIKRKYSPHKIYFIIGADIIKNLHLWKDYKDLFKECEFILASRTGYFENLDNYILNLKEDGLILHKLYFEPIDISSTDIRQGNFDFQNTDKKVIKYIEENNLYQKPLDNLEKILSKERFLHTKSVMDTAVELAKIHQVNIEDAITAAIFHDYAKEMPANEKEEYLKKHGIEVTEIYKKQPDLMHQTVSMLIAKHEYAVNNEDVLNAIAYHTTGRANMSLLEKILYLADFIEPMRPQDDIYLQVKEESKKNLDLSIYIMLKFKVDKVKRRGLLLHPLSIEALNYYLNLGGIYEQ